jgi:hypothetical protein
MASSALLTPHHISTQRVSPPPRTKRRGVHTRRAVRGWGVNISNISEDARHRIGLLQYNPSTVFHYEWSLDVGSGLYLRCVQKYEYSYVACS